MKPVNILGISAFYHDSAAGLVRDGDIVAAAQEERFTRKKHDSTFPAGPWPTAFAKGASTPRRPGLRGFLRQAVPQVRADSGDLPRLRPRGLRVLPHGHPALAQAEALDAGNILKELDFRARSFSPNTTSRTPRRPSSRPRSGGGVSDRGRRGGVDHDQLRHRARQPMKILAELQFPAFAGPALLGLHLLHAASRSTPASTS